MKLAKALGATITGVYVAPPFVPQVYSEAAVYYSAPFSASEYRKFTANVAKKALGPLERAARTAGVRCRTRLLGSETNRVLARSKIPVLVVR